MPSQLAGVPSFAKAGDGLVAAPQVKPTVATLRTEQLLPALAREPTRAAQALRRQRIESARNGGAGKGHCVTGNSRPASSASISSECRAAGDGVHGMDEFACAAMAPDTAQKKAMTRLRRRGNQVYL